LSWVGPRDVGFGQRIWTYGRRGLVGFLRWKVQGSSRRGLEPSESLKGGSKVNAAFLLVTTAWLAGADAAAKPATPQAPPATPQAPSAAPYAAPGGYTGCCGGCDSCGDECCHGGLLSRLRGMFHKDCCDTCSTCNTSNTCNTCTTTTTTCGSCDTCCESKWSKFRGWFRKGHDCDTCDSCNSCGGGVIAAPAPSAAVPKGEPIPAPKGSEPPKEMPKDKTTYLRPAPAVPTTTSLNTLETKSPFELTRRDDSRGSHAPDYSCITGQLFFVHADGGLWLLRYAPLSEEDPNGGSVVLARDVTMDSYREGDLVTVHGRIIDDHASKFLGGPLYRASSVQLIERKPQ